MMALAEELAIERAAAGTPIECWWYHFPKGCRRRWTSWGTTLPLAV